MACVDPQVGTRLAREFAGVDCEVWRQRLVAAELPTGLRYWTRRGIGRRGKATRAGRRDEVITAVLGARVRKPVRSILTHGALAAVRKGSRSDPLRIGAQ